MTSFYNFGTIITTEQYLDFRSIDLSKHIKTKQSLSYLPWAVAIDVMRSKMPELDVAFESPDGGLSIVYGNPEQGYYIKAYMVNHNTQTRTAPIYQAIRDFRNKAVLSLTVTDITNTVQRATAKAIAMHTGICANLYSQIDESIESLSPNRLQENKSGVAWIEPDFSKGLDSVILWATEMLNVTEDEAREILEKTPANASGKKASNFTAEIKRLWEQN